MLQRLSFLFRSSSFPTPGRGCARCLPRALLLLRLPEVPLPAPGLPWLPSVRCSPRSRDWGGDPTPLGSGEPTETRSFTSLSCPCCELRISLPLFKSRKLWSQAGMVLLPFSLKLVAVVSVMACVRYEPRWGSISLQSWMSNGCCRETLTVHKDAREKGTFSSRVPVLGGKYFRPFVS